ncbi:hypothetical protein [Gordonia rhizosphera]|nr:hypothetical protein [Gordonia rhizosphera]
MAMPFVSLTDRGVVGSTDTYHYIVYISAGWDLDPLASQVRSFALYVVHDETSTETTGASDIQVKDPDFRLHLRNRKPSRQTELDQWWMSVLVDAGHRDLRKGQEF